MSRYAHKTKTKRKLITVQEWARWAGYSRVRMTSFLQWYQQDHTYDSHDIFSVLEFGLYLVTKGWKK